MEISVPWQSALRWRSLGRVEIHEGSPKLPDGVAKLHPNLPGLYWFQFSKNSYHYIGQTGRLKERLKEYQSPTLGTLQEYFIRQALLHSEGGNLYICTDDDLGDLSDVKKRRALEDHEKRAAWNAKQKLLNRSKPLDPYVADLADEACKQLLKDWLHGKRLSG
jgi:hypothetical protein